MISGTARKIPCRYCLFPVHRGNMERHERACLRRAETRRRRELREAGLL